MKEGYVSIKETAKLLDCSARNVFRLIRAGKLKAEKNESTLRVRLLKANVEQYIAQRTAISDAREFIDSPTLNLSKINEPFRSEPKRDEDAGFHLIEVSDSVVRRVAGPAPPEDQNAGMTPEEINAAYLAEENAKPVIWVGNVGFHGIVDGMTAEVRALLYQEQLKQARAPKRFSQVRGI